MELVSLEDLRAAALRLRGVALRTPLLPASGLDGVFWKAESLQRGGAFKLRGAYNFVSQIPAEVRARGLVAPSSGNHAQAVALAGKMLGAPVTVVMPTTVTKAKRDGCDRLGARVELAGTTTKHRYDRAVEIARADRATLVPPYDDPRIIAGQGTVGLEIVEELPDVETVLVPVGGGGLSAGVATAVKLLKPGVRVVGVEPEAAPKLSRARAAGKPVEIPLGEGLADGLLAVQIGAIPFAHLERYLDDVVAVPDAALPRAMRHLLERERLVVEPSGAACVAAVLEGLVDVRGPTVAVLSGGNIAFEALVEIVARP
ncbi:MAG TPA: threonine/serine dehydratase [Polyangia bacterium]|jgi:threonine dehydratase|nr:threonine/serine dehydratase [Polyangia bacterium]